MGDVASSTKTRGFGATMHSVQSSSSVILPQFNSNHPSNQSLSESVWDSDSCTNKRPTSTSVANISRCKKDVKGEASEFEDPTFSKCSSLGQSFRDDTYLQLRKDMSFPSGSVLNETIFDLRQYLKESEAAKSDLPNAAKPGWSRDWSTSASEQSTARSERFQFDENGMHRRGQSSSTRLPTLYQYLESEESKGSLSCY